MLKRHEKVLKTHAQWRKKNQVKKIRIVMTVILIAISISVAAGLLLAWSQLSKLSDSPGSSGSSLPAVGSSSGSDGLPSYDDSFNLVLVNMDHPLGKDFHARLTDFKGEQVDERIVPALKKMMSEAEADGCPLTLSGGYVSNEEQDRLYEAEVDRLMREDSLSRVRAENQAQNTIGAGGYNENQTGMAVTFSADGKQGDAFASTKQYHWLAENGVYYGFILRYPQNKESMTGTEFQPDHFRYVGGDNAVKMREFSMCLEEYHTYLAKREQN